MSIWKLCSPTILQEILYKYKIHRFREKIYLKDFILLLFLIKFSLKIKIQNSFFDSYNSHNNPMWCLRVCVKSGEASVIWIKSGPDKSVRTDLFFNAEFPCGDKHIFYHIITFKSNFPSSYISLLLPDFSLIPKLTPFSGRILEIPLCKTNFFLIFSQKEDTFCPTALSWKSKWD